MNENIYIAIIIASIATYICRTSGVFFSTRLKVESNIFELIKCISIGVIIAVIARIILFPVGLLEASPINSRLIGVFFLFISYFLFKKNILLSTILGTTSFFLSNYLNILLL